MNAKKMFISITEINIDYGYPLPTIKSCYLSKMCAICSEWYVLVIQPL